MIEGKIGIETEKTEVDQMIGQDQGATITMIGGGDEKMITIKITMIKKSKYILERISIFLGCSV
jgi:hypothetical protein